MCFIGWGANNPFTRAQSGGGVGEASLGQSCWPWAAFGMHCFLTWFGLWVVLFLRSPWPCYQKGCLGCCRIEDLVSKGTSVVRGLRLRSN